MRGLAHRLLFRGLLALNGPGFALRRLSSLQASLELRGLLFGQRGPLPQDRRRRSRRVVSVRERRRRHEARRRGLVGGLLDGDAFFLLLGRAGFLLLRRAAHVQEFLLRRVRVLRQTISDEGVLEARRMVAVLAGVPLRLRDELLKNEIERGEIIFSGARNPSLLRAARVQELAVFGEALDSIGVCGQQFLQRVTHQRRLTMTEHAQGPLSEGRARPRRVRPVRYVFVPRVLPEPRRAARLEILVVQHDVPDAREFRVHRRLLVHRGLVEAP